VDQGVARIAGMHHVECLWGAVAERRVLQRLTMRRLQRAVLALRLTNGAKNTTLLEPCSVAVVTKWQTRGLAQRRNRSSCWCPVRACSSARAWARPALRLSNAPACHR